MDVLWGIIEFEIETDSERGESVGNENAMFMPLEEIKIAR